jgi:hypothetical protein
MPKGWKHNVYRTDLEKEEFVGFFFDSALAETWVASRKEGTYEVSTQKPRERLGSTGAEGGAEDV